MKFVLFIRNKLEPYKQMLGESVGFLVGGKHIFKNNVLAKAATCFKIFPNLVII